MLSLPPPLSPSSPPTPVCTCHITIHSICATLHNTHMSAAALCSTDADCKTQGMYCGSKKQCVRYSPEYCNKRQCGLGDAGASGCRFAFFRTPSHTDLNHFLFSPLPGCDPDDLAGCAPGLICGTNNCAKFHDIGTHSGMTPRSACCDRKASTTPSPRGDGRLLCP